MAVRWLCRWASLLLHFAVHALQSPSDGTQRSPAAPSVLELLSEGHVGLVSRDAGAGAMGASLLEEAAVSTSGALDFSAAILAIESDEGNAADHSGCISDVGLKTVVHNASSFLSLRSAVDLGEVPSVAVFRKVAVKRFCREPYAKSRRVMPPQQCALLCGRDPTCRSYAVAPSADGEETDCPMCQVYKSECRDQESSVSRCGSPTYIFRRVPFRQVGTGFFCDGDPIHTGDEPLPVCVEKCASNDKCRSVTYVESENLVPGNKRCQSCHTFTGKCRNGIAWPMAQCHGGQATSFSKRRYCKAKNPNNMRNPLESPPGHWSFVPE